MEISSDTIDTKKSATKSSTVAETNTTSFPDVKDALNEYFKLKLKYETLIMNNKKQILNNQTLSNREKRSEFLKLKPKCINCKRPGGTRFQTTFFPETDTDESYREHRATCGVVADPCPLNIKIQIGKVEMLPDILNSMEKDIKDAKNEVIDNKNKLLFGYLTTEEVLEKFESLKDTINYYSSLYEAYLGRFNDLVDNDETNTEINESITNSYIQINQIKDCIKKMNETDNVQYARDAVNIYINTLVPLMKKTRALKYNETMVWHNNDTNTCNLIQNKYSIQNLSYTSFQNKVVAFDIGEGFIAKKKPGLVIESSPESSNESEEGKFVVKPLHPKPNKEIPQDEPIYGQGKDGIAWNIPEYNKLWEFLPTKLKNVLRLDNEWIKSFMFNCVNARAKSQDCTFTAPRDLKMPPEKLSDGKYDLGVQIYSDEFNKLPKGVQDNYLKLYSTKDGVTDYKLFINAMNDIVAKAVDFTHL
jgi:uncharacterized protein Yka (UPF0111/DUF47 family)